MDAETFHSTTRPASSRISYDGEMVAESMLQQMDEELLLEEMAMQGSRLQSPDGRKLLVALKLNGYCQEILAWTITELARPGDHILAFHVSSCATHSETTSREHEEHFEELADTLGGFLDIYEDLCNLKQVKLEVEILPGVEVKKVLVDFARSHETCTLILGSNKHFTVRNKLVGRYCLSRLPYTCRIVVLQHGEIILNGQGQLRIDPTSPGAGMIKTLRSRLRSFGRNSKKAMNVGFDEGHDDPPRPSESLHMKLCHGEQSMGYTDHSTELEKCYHSDSSLFPGFGYSSVISSSNVEVERSDMFILEDQHDTQPFSPAKSYSVHASPICDSRDLETPRISEALDFDAEDLVIPGWPLMHHSIGFDTLKLDLNLQDCACSNEEPLAPSPPHFLAEEKSVPSSLRSQTTDKVKPPRSPLHRMFSDLKRSFPNQLDRHVSIVDWALKLPSRSKDPSKSPTLMTFTEDICTKILREIALDAFRVGSDQVMEEISLEPSVEAGSTGLSTANIKEEFSLNMAKTKDVPEGGNVFLAHKLDSLCWDRKCTKFSYEELEAGTYDFSSNNVVGRGGGSEVYKGEMVDGRLVAVKRLNCGPQAEEEFLNDVDINTSLSHPHVVPLLGYCADSSHLMLVYDYLQEGNLEDRLHAGTKAPVLPWRVRYKVAVGTAKALDYLHHGTSRPVIHRDVKSSNILLTADFEAQLSDFGLAKWAPKKASHLLCDDIFGTFGYLAPEYFMYGRVNNKTDVYAFGVVLLELITGRPPIDNNKPKGQENLVNWARPLLEENCLEKLVDSRLEGAYDVDQMKRMLLAASLCVQQSSQRRPQMSRVLQILCSSRGRLQNIRTRSEEREESTCIDLEEDHEEDFEEGDISIEDTPTFSRCTTDVQTHLALAMLGVDDDLTVLSSSDHSGVDLLHLDGRFSLSSSLVQ